MFFENWVYSALRYLGLYYKNVNLILLGLDNAGKSTLLHVLKVGRASQQEYNIQPEELILGTIKFNIFEYGEHKVPVRRERINLEEMDAIVFVIDATDRERFPLVRKEISELLKIEGIQHTPFLVFGNKIDLPNAATEEEMISAIGLESFILYPVERVRPIRVFMCSVKFRFGYADGFKWLSNILN